MNKIQFEILQEKATEYEGFRIGKIAKKEFKKIAKMQGISKTDLFKKWIIQEMQKEKDLF